MGKYPVLRPKEVVTILEKLALRKSDSAALTNNFAIQMGDAQQYHFTPAGTFHQSF